MAATDAAPPLVILLEYRAAIETVDLDAANEASWKEALDSFGYQNLDAHTFLQELALSSSAEVMMALCPYTTQDEWGPALNKRDVRLSSEVEGMCYANVVPIPGVGDLISNASKLRRTTVIFLSPFRSDITERLLNTSGLARIIDVVVCYTSLDAAVLEALGSIHCAPPSFPQRIGPPPAGANRAVSDAEYAGADIVAFLSTTMACKKMKGYGMSLVGVMHNNLDQEADVDDEDDTAETQARPVLPGRDTAATLMEAGAELCVMNYKEITPGHLSMLRSARATAAA